MNVNILRSPNRPESVCSNHMRISSGTWINLLEGYGVEEVKFGKQHSSTCMEGGLASQGALHWELTLLSAAGHCILSEQKIVFSGGMNLLLDESSLSIDPQEWLCSWCVHSWTERGLSENLQCKMVKTEMTRGAPNLCLNQKSFRVLSN